jgi:hypothetical protein
MAGIGDDGANIGEQWIQTAEQLCGGRSVRDIGGCHLTCDQQSGCTHHNVALSSRDRKRRL